MYFRQIANFPKCVPRPETASALTRRTFLELTTIAGTGLTLGVMLPACSGGTRSSVAAAAPLLMPFVRVDTDNGVTLICKHLETGQGVWTGLAAVLAEEVDAAWDQ